MHVCWGTPQSEGVDEAQTPAAFLWKQKHLADRSAGETVRRYS